MATSEEYWSNRSSQRLVNAEQLGNQAILRSQKVYDQALRNIKSQIQSIYDNYAEKGILDVSELKKAIGNGGANEFLRAIKVNAENLGLDPKKIYDERYLSRLTRLEALQEQIKLEVMTIAPQEQRITGRKYNEILSRSYESAQRDLELQGVNPSFSTLDRRMLSTILGSTWAEGNYSSRVWGNISDFATKLPTIIGGALTSGTAIEATTRLVRDQFDIKKSDAARLVRTETNYFHNQVELQSYIDDGVEWYDFVTALEPCPICLSIAAGGPYRVSEIVVGVNYPTIHPNDRCSTLIRFKGEERKGRPSFEERTQRFIEFDNNSLQDRWKDAMQSQMNPNKAAHDYNAEINQITQNLRNKIINNSQFQEELSNLMTRIPDNDPLRPSIEHIAKIQGWDGVTKNEISVKKMFDKAGWDYSNVTLSPQQIDFIAKSGIEFDNKSAKASVFNQGQFDPDTNKLSMASERISATQEALNQNGLFNNVFNHELGHAIDHYGNLLNSKVDDQFSNSKSFGNMIAGNTYNQLGPDAISVVKNRIANGIENESIRQSIMQTKSENFASQVITQGAIKTGNVFTQIPKDTLEYFTKPEEIFAEAYSIYHINPDYLEHNAPRLFQYFNSVSKLTL